VQQRYGYLRIRNLRCIEEADLKLNNFVIVAGYPGVGKSNISRAAYLGVRGCTMDAFFAEKLVYTLFFGKENAVRKVDGRYMEPSIIEVGRNREGCKVEVTLKECKCSGSAPYIDAVLIPRDYLAYLRLAYSLNLSKTSGALDYRTVVALGAVLGELVKLLRSHPVASLMDIFFVDVFRVMLGEEVSLGFTSGLVKALGELGDRLFKELAKPLKHEEEEQKDIAVISSKTLKERFILKLLDRIPGNSIVIVESVDPILSHSLVKGMYDRVLEKNLTLLMTIDTGPLDDPVTAALIRRYVSFIGRPLEEVVERIVFYNMYFDEKKKVCWLEEVKPRDVLVRGTYLG